MTKLDFEERLVLMDAADTLGLGPSVKEVERWFLDLGYERTVVGQSLQGRDLVTFRKRFADASSTSTTTDSPQPSSHHRTVLFQSLVHGNEPLGLLALLHTASALSAGHSMHRMRSLLQSSEDIHSLDLVFFPMVNVDAYQLNLNALANKGAFGCRRTNMRAICPSIPEDDAGACPFIPDQGIDINRNFPADFKSSDFEVECPLPTRECCSAHPGDTPFSEPESQAIREAVNQFQPDAAISFHSQDFEKTSILLYPFASPIDHTMNDQDLKRFQTWGRAMEPRRGVYSVGDPFGALGYRASGTCLDWMYASKNVTVFVLESSSPCGNRWCDEKKYGRRMRTTARMYASSGVTLVDLVLGAPAQTHYWSGTAAMVVIVVVLGAWLSGGRCHLLLLRLIRSIQGRQDSSAASGSKVVEMQRFV